MPRPPVGAGGPGSDARVRMRWDNLFDDLESQLESGISAEEHDLQAEEERLRLGRLRLRDRLVALHQASAASADYVLRLELVTTEVVNLRPAAFGRDWLSGEVLGDPAGRVERHPQFVLPLAAIGVLHLSREQVRQSLTPPATPVVPSLGDRLGLPFVLRDLCRRRLSVEALLPGGGATGTIDRVGHDHFDLALHDAGSPRRESNVTGMRIVPFSQLVLVRL